MYVYIYVLKKLVYKSHLIRFYKNSKNMSELIKIIVDIHFTKYNTMLCIPFKIFIDLYFTSEANSESISFLRNAINL